ncbi:MAG: hypothetical protein ACJAYF_000393 [Arenicella sp.]|jgi:hypothetical protein
MPLLINWIQKSFLFIKSLKNQMLETMLLIAKVLGRIAADDEITKYFL